MRVVTVPESETICLLAISPSPLASARGVRFALLGGSTTVVVIVVKVVTVVVIVVKVATVVVIVVKVVSVSVEYLVDFELARKGNKLCIDRSWKV
jgi:hypothetical protein